MEGIDRVITVMGGTGYTGRLVAAELNRRGHRFAIAGRRAAKLQEVSAAFGNVETLIADATHPQSLVRLASSSSVIINCAGPFIDLGEPVVQAAIEHGAHYLDTTGEQPYIMKIRAHDGAAKRQKVAVAPAMAFEVALADCAVSIGAEGFAELQSVHVTYEAPMHTSAGTRRTMLRMLQSEGYAYLSGHWVAEPLAAQQIDVDFPPPIGRARAMSFPSAEVVTVPMHEKVREVRTFMVLPRAVVGALSFLRPLLPATASVAATLLERWRGANGNGPDERVRSGDRFQIAIDVRGIRDGRAHARRVLVSGADPYGLSATIAVNGAEMMLRSGFAAAGVLPPALVLEPRPFLDALKRDGVAYSIHDD